MRLSIFILSDLDEILREWEAFASTIVPLKEATRIELRDHAAAVLKVIATDLLTPQGEGARDAKSKGLAPSLALDTAAETHAESRMSSGLNGDQVMAEFRALRASVLRLWTQRNQSAAPKKSKTWCDLTKRSTRPRPNQWRAIPNFFATRRVCFLRFSVMMCDPHWGRSAWGPKYYCTTKHCRQKYSKLGYVFLTALNALMR